jgi:Ala-tRNA(Pro) deacylase
MPPRAVVEFLDRQRTPYQVLRHVRTYTAQGSAASLHVPGRDFAKPVMLKTGEGHLVMAVVPAPRTVDLGAAEQALGVTVELAREAEFAPRFPDCEVGAEPPFGQLYGIPVYVDESLGRDPEIVFNAGTHGEAIRMRYEDFERLVRPAVARLSRAS